MTQYQQPTGSTALAIENNALRQQNAELQQQVEELKQKNEHTRSTMQQAIDLGMQSYRDVCRERDQLRAETVRLIRAVEACGICRNELEGRYTVVGKTRHKIIKECPEDKWIGEWVAELQQRVKELEPPAKAWQRIMDAMQAIGALPSDGEDVPIDRSLDAYITVWAKMRDERDQLRSEITEQDKEVIHWRTEYTRTADERDQLQQKVGGLEQDLEKVIAERDEWMHKAHLP